MYALAINGSPRKGGNTELLLKAVLSELNDAHWETELVTVGGTAIRGCLACEKGSITSLLMNSEYINEKKVIENQKSPGHSF